MNYWIAAFAVALVVVIGAAAGPLGAAVSVIAFAATLFLLWAHKLGFLNAWTRFGLDRFAAPFLEGDNYDRLSLIASDGEKLAKACTVAVVLIALSLLLPAYQVGILVAGVGAWYLYQIRRANAPAKAAPATLELPAAKGGAFKPAEARTETRVN
ncbi:hypothetical protein CCR97_12105 [Rhodoplanes elegans]|uniref:Uncharacterized protein n=1 Tax=Rhodoplanes elegans TaxID=29408 RepID=A0A327KF88_9BRAD|nr:hypothetical protein [Rhodoplanes elegans]MBK5958946.1 hypothetical protein [Rhodoplanes elegans]RAI36215.1 hypothetical protein CH338_17940 [Rhodoplanes elegans]